VLNAKDGGLRLHERATQGGIFGSSEVGPGTWYAVWWTMREARRAGGSVRDHRRLPMKRKGPWWCGSHRQGAHASHVAFGVGRVDGRGRPQVSLREKIWPCAATSDVRALVGLCVWGGWPNLVGVEPFDAHGTHPPAGRGNDIGLVRRQALCETMPKTSAVGYAGSGRPIPARCETPPCAAGSAGPCA
jgi:hypothetical protein